MHGNTPYAGSPTADSKPTPERRRTLRRELASVAASTRELLSDEFIVGGEISDGDDGSLRATIAVRPPVGSVISAGIDPDATDDADVDTLARDLAAGAVFEAKHAARDTHSSAS
ncbi:MAG: DUF5811 family protein [Halobacteriota archaeon]|uniref:DUF5811 family protein n=1 Tax=Natronomonas sp. TaxID=2184060 RepID=UPI003974D889